MNLNIIDTDRFILRPWNEEDAEDLFIYASDPDIGTPAGWPPHKSLDESREVIRNVFSAPETYAVVLKETYKPVGCCGIMFANSLHSGALGPDEAEIGYWIGKPFWGRGLIPEAVRTLLKRCFEDLSLNAVWCCFYDGNIKSRRVCEKCGFKYHHTNQPVPSPLGDLRTEHYYKMTLEDYINFLQNKVPNNPGPVFR